MSKGLPRSLSRGNPQRQDIMKQVVKVKDLPINVIGASGVGYGAGVMGDFPEGNVLFLGAVSYLSFSTVAAGVQAAFDGDYSIGSAPTADATLAGADVDIIPSTALGAATGKVSPRVRGANATQVMLDNTDGSLELNINLLIDDANISADSAFLANGELHIAYIMLGDD